jgi:hypothetical protein
VALVIEPALERVVIPDKAHRAADPGPPEAPRSRVGPGSSRCALVRDDNPDVAAAANTAVFFLEAAKPRSIRAPEDPARR